MYIPKFVIPVLVGAALLGSFELRVAFTQPTVSVIYDDVSNARLVCAVEGLTCKGMANLFTGLYRNTPGISSIQTYASERKACFTYDSTVISPEEIRVIMEQQIRFRDGSSSQVFRCVRME